MQISIMVAVDNNFGIGANGKIPWHLSSDLKRLKNITMGHHLIMGRKTYQSINHPLSGRKNIIVTRSLDLYIDQCQIAHSITEGIQLAQQDNESELFVLGGSEIYHQALPNVTKLYLTKVLIDAHCDVFFPVINFTHWSLIKKEFIPADLYNEWPSIFEIYEKPH